LATEPERYLRKARESLASAQADVRAKRYNSAANRAYYAAFQAVVAALVWQSIRPTGAWQHKFVTNQFSGKLVRRRKVIPSGLASTIDGLFRTRVKADYESEDVSQIDAQSALRHAIRFVEEVERAMTRSTLREASAQYDTRSAEPEPSLDLVERRISELQELVRSKYPEAEFDVVRLGPSDYRVNTFINQRTYVGFNRLLGSWTSDVLVDDGVWIVVIPSRLSRTKDN